MSTEHFNMQAHSLLFQIILLFLIFQYCQALYSEEDHVINLTSENFENTVLKSDNVWIVEFFTPWCMYCKNIASEYKKAAKALRGIVSVGAVNADVDKGLPAKYEVRGLPTIKIFGADRIDPEHYNEPRNAKKFIESGLRAARNLILSRLDPEDQEDFLESTADLLNVIELTENNFDEMVLKSTEPWMVEFYTQWCGHCKALEPQWCLAAKSLEGKVKFGRIDGAANKNLATQYKVTAYPDIKFFATDKETVLDYNGGRKSIDIEKWVTEKVQRRHLPEVQEILNEDTLRKYCERKKMCIVSFLPTLLDCEVSCRNSYLKTLHTLADKFNTYKWGWMWCEGAEQHWIEDALNITEPYPILAAVNHRKRFYVLLDKPFTEDNIFDFLTDVAEDKKAVTKITVKELPDINDVSPWDGTDGTVSIEGLYKEEL